jgi:hypothetical protein
MNVCPIFMEERERQNDNKSMSYRQNGHAIMKEEEMD